MPPDFKPAKLCFQIPFGEHCSMKSLLKAEELAQLLVALFLLYYLGAPWYWYLVLFIGPDISMLGYAINPRIGAWTYNLFHHKGVGFMVAIIGFFSLDVLLLAGIAMIGHSAMDRIFGYGLKYEKGFKYTHLGEIGKHGKA